MVSSLRPANTLAHLEEFISVKDVQDEGIEGGGAGWLGARPIICCQPVATSRNLAAAKKQKLNL